MYKLCTMRDALCTMRDGERLQLLKEVAGTTVYDEKKEESLAKMEENKSSMEKISETLEYMENKLDELKDELDAAGSGLEGCRVYTVR